MSELECRMESHRGAIAWYLSAEDTTNKYFWAKVPNGLCGLAKAVLRATASDSIFGALGSVSHRQGTPACWRLDG